MAVSTATPNIEISSLNFDPDILSRQTQSKGTSTLKGTRNIEILQKLEAEGRCLARQYESPLILTYHYVMHQLQWYSI